MKAYLAHIEQMTAENKNFREVLFTGQHSQLVVMALKPNEEIGTEVHQVTDQFLRIESGEGKAIIDGEELIFKEGDALVVPAGAQHNVINTSSEKLLQLYTVYSPPHHKDGTVHATKEDAEADTEDHL